MNDINSMQRRHRAALTRAKNSGDQQKIIDACDKAFADFERYGWPDSWSEWQRAKDDAQFALRRAA
jgi:hypothetical protein